MRTALALISLTACAETAVLELTIEIPDRGAVFCEDCTVQTIVIDARSGMSPAFDDEGDTIGFVLDGDAHAISIVATGEDIEAPLDVRARFCPDSACAPDAPELRVYYPRAFYAGEHTYHRLDFTFAPDRSTRLPDVHPCNVRGCAAAITSWYCTGDDRHLCE